MILAIVLSCLLGPSAFAEGTAEGALGAEPSLAAVAARLEAQRRAAPRWVRRLAARPVGYYGPIATLVDPAALARGRALLTRDVLRLLDYFEADPAARRATGSRLERFAAKMTYQALARPCSVAPGRRAPVATLTLEQMIAREQFRTLGGGPNVFARARRLFAGDHLRGATPGVVGIVYAAVADRLRQFVRHPHVDRLRKFAPVAAVVGTSALTLWAVEHFGHTHFLTGFFLGAVQVGILGPLVSAATGWLVTPTTEYLKVWNSRFTGEAEQAINQFFDRFKPNADANESYDQVRVAHRAVDGGDVAGMTARQQRSGWAKALRLFNGVPKTYNRLLRHSQHHGRSLITALWADEVATAATAKQFEKNLVDLHTNDETLLGPYRAALIARGEFDRNDQLTEVYRELTTVLSAQPWHRLTRARCDRAFARVRAITARLRREFDVSEYVIDRLIENQRHAAESTAVTIATLAINELRYLFYAEANRNMEDEAREVQRQIRRSLLIQNLVERYQSQIQSIHRAMGFANGGCEGALAG